MNLGAGGNLCAGRAGRFALIWCLRKPTRFASASPFFKAGISGEDGRVASRREVKKKINNQKKNKNQVTVNNFNY